jgi:hypothetical protein
MYIYPQSGENNSHFSIFGIMKQMCQIIEKGVLKQNLLIMRAKKSEQIIIAGHISYLFPWDCRIP